MVHRIKKEAAKLMVHESVPRSEYSLADVQAQFQDSHYSYLDAIQLICGIPIERVNGVPNVQPRRAEHVIQDSSAIRFVLEQDIMEALREDFCNVAFAGEEEKIPEDYTDHLFVLGDRKGSLTPHQLFLMSLFHKAIDDVQAVIGAVGWLRRIKTTREMIRAPFNEISDHVDQGFIDAAIEAAERMPLDEVRTSLDLTDGTKLLEVASSEWLSTTSVNAILSCITSLHEDVGVVKADYFTVGTEDVRKRILASTGAFSKEHTRLVSIVNLSDKHWQVFYIDFDDGESVLYDPLPVGRDGRLKTLERKVQELVAPYRDVRISYQKHTEVFGKFDQDDGGSCGVYCGVFLEYMMKRIMFKESSILPSRVYRARYLVLLSATLRKLAENEEPLAGARTVVLYDNTNFGGASTAFNAPYDSTCYNIWDCFNDKAASAKWIDFSAYYVFDTLNFYADADCKGAKYAVSGDDHYLRGATVANFGAMNDRISSFSTYTGMTGITGYTGYKCSTRRGGNETDAAIEPMPITGV